MTAIKLADMRNSYDALLYSCVRRHDSLLHRREIAIVLVTVHNSYELRRMLPIRPILAHSLFEMLPSTAGRGSFKEFPFSARFHLRPNSRCSVSFSPRAPRNCNQKRTGSRVPSIQLIALVQHQKRYLLLSSDMKPANLKVTSP
jgi:hypothetical protein